MATNSWQKSEWVCLEWKKMSYKCLVHKNSWSFTKFVFVVKNGHIFEIINFFELKLFLWQLLPLHFLLKSESNDSSLFNNVNYKWQTAMLLYHGEKNPLRLRENTK